MIASECPQPMTNRQRRTTDNEQGREERLLAPEIQSATSKFLIHSIRPFAEQFFGRETTSAMVATTGICTISGFRHSSSWFFGWMRAFAAIILLVAAAPPYYVMVRGFKAGPSAVKHLFHRISSRNKDAAVPRKVVPPSSPTPSQLNYRIFDESEQNRYGGGNNGEGRKVSTGSGRKAFYIPQMPWSKSERREKNEGTCPEEGDGLYGSTATAASAKSESFDENTARMTIVTDANQLRQKVLDEGVPLSQLEVRLLEEEANATLWQLVGNHDVLRLIADRFEAGSTPDNREAGDSARLALALEGGGMRGAVSAGMSAAIACLGLVDVFDAVYGSSAGSVIGAYMISRQMCMDVYVDLLPAAKRQFISVRRFWRALAADAFNLALAFVFQGRGLDPNTKIDISRTLTPGMNISYVLDSIMHDQHGLRPLDLKQFQENDRKQPLRVASSYIQNGKLMTKCFGTQDFFCPKSSVRSCARSGLYACLEASMNVPGATGPPIQISVNSQNNKKGGTNETSESIPFFDAFCFEPLPYRSAVEEGATHVLVLCSRPEGFQPKTQQGIYELGVAPLYFRSHGHPEMATFFEKGGQQYIYAEDLLTLEEGKKQAVLEGNVGDGILIPPCNILHGVELDEITTSLASDRGSWNRAHLLPIKVPSGTPELHTLEQDRNNVLQAVRAGFAVAFDILAPTTGLSPDTCLKGSKVAELVFPEEDLGDGALNAHLSIVGDAIKQAVVSEVHRERYSFDHLTSQVKVRLLQMQRSQELTHNQIQKLLGTLHLRSESSHHPKRDQFRPHKNSNSTTSTRLVV